MNEFKKFPKGKIRKNGNFYLWALVFAFSGFWGAYAILSGELPGRHGTISLEGKAAVAAGMAFVAYAAYALYHMFFKLEKIEVENESAHELENFEEEIVGYNTKFEITHSCIPTGSSFVHTFYYKLEIRLNKPLSFDINIKQRDKIEFILWKIGLTRLFDVLTKNYYFDSQYRVKCSDKDEFKRIFNGYIIHLLEEFDRDYPPIRKKNGYLEISQNKFKYVEGPYATDQKLLDPHRGCIEKIFIELTKIISEVERSI
jgi:hypothetical protein